MDENELKQWALIGLILLVGFGVVPLFLFEWLFKNVFSPIGAIEGIAWALNSANPWDWVARLFLLLIAGFITATAAKTAKDWIKEKIGL